MCSAEIVPAGDEKHQLATGESPADNFGRAQLYQQIPLLYTRTSEAPWDEDVSSATIDLTSGVIDFSGGIVRGSESAESKSSELEDRPIDEPGRAAIIDNLVGALNQHFVFPEVASKLEQALRAGQVAGSFDTSSSKRFAELLRAKLLDVAKDGHLDVEFDSRGFPDFEKPVDQQVSADSDENARRAIQGFMLDDSVGLLKLNSFDSLDSPSTVRAIKEAMKEVAGSQALIVDLRENGGGDPSTVAHVLSYLVEPGTHVNSVIFRNEDPNNPNLEWNENENGWEQKFITSDQGSDALKADRIFVLTGRNTFSGGEEFAYDLQTMGRGKIIGERTGGGANPARIVNLGPNFVAAIPIGRALNPYTLTNWERVGVTPHIGVPEGLALEAALKLARR